MKQCLQKPETHPGPVVLFVSPVFVKLDNVGMLQMDQVIKYSLYLLLNPRKKDRKHSSYNKIVQNVAFPLAHRELL